MVMTRSPSVMTDHAGIAADPATSSARLRVAVFHLRSGGAGVDHTRVHDGIRKHCLRSPSVVLGLRVVLDAATASLEFEHGDPVPGEHEAIDGPAYQMPAVHEGERHLMNRVACQVNLANLGSLTQGAVGGGHLCDQHHRIAGLRSLARTYQTIDRRAQRRVVELPGDAM